MGPGLGLNSERGRIMKDRPVFEHRHYKAIAAEIAEMRYLPIGADAQGAVIERFVALFASDNPRFDRARFLAAASGKPVNGRDKVRP